MSRVVFKLPDLGEGTVAAEIISWRVKPGDVIAEDDPLVEMMTEKATVEVPAPASGRVVSLTGFPGDRVAVGAELAVFETESLAAQGGERGSSEAAAEPPRLAQISSLTVASLATQAVQSATAVPVDAGPSPSPVGDHRGHVRTSPAIRRRASDAGIDLKTLTGSGPQGRIVLQDLEEAIEARRGVGIQTLPSAPVVTEGGVGAPPPAGETEEVRVIGLRRVIAERMSESARTIPHFSYVEEVDVTELEELRTYLNSQRAADHALTYLPFIVLALVRTLPAHRQCNARYDAERGVVLRHRSIHVGIATQTPDGLKVPVLRDAQNRSLDEVSAEIRRVSEAARGNQAARGELTGSTITITSLGKLGGIASTPIINAPELAIVGVNRASERPVVRQGTIAVRRMMNLSSSFDHRFVDGQDAAEMIQTLKGYLERPSTIFLAPS